MAHDEFEKIDPRKRQSLDHQTLDQSTDQSTQPLRQEPKPLNQLQTTAPSLESQTSLDKLPSRPNRWLLPGVFSAGLVILAAAFVTPRLLLQGNRSSDTSLPTTSEPVSSTAAEDAAIANQQAAILLEQAQLLAEEGGSQGLTEAIAIAQSIPVGTDAYATAQAQIAPWNQQLLEAKADAANTPIASDAEMPPQIAQQQVEIAALQRQIDQEVALASAARQQRQTAETQMSDLQNQLTNPPVPVQPAPNQELITAQQELVQQQARTQDLLAQLNQAQNQTANLLNQEQPVSEATATLLSPQPTLSPAATQPVQQTQPPTRPQTQSPTQNGNSAPATASDPYLNVNIPTAPVPQTLAATPTASAPSTGNSYGFNNVVVSAPTVAIELRDNVDEDGDFVTLRVNGQDYASYQQIWNRGQVFMVPLQPGDNQVEILGDKDGTGGITLEVNVAGIGNINSRPIPEGSTASFVITRQ